MKIQSLSVVVPNKACVNNCKFCCSKMHHDLYPLLLSTTEPHYDLYEKDYIKRLEFARDNGCNSVMLTGSSEPQQNRRFLQIFGTMNSNLSKPFRQIELQTTGVKLDSNYLRFLRNHVGVSTISLSVSSFDDAQNIEIIQMPAKYTIRINQLASTILEYGFNLRLSLNLTNCFDEFTPHEIFNRCKNLGANQITFRKLYSVGDDSQKANWVKNNSIDENNYHQINEFVEKEGRKLEILETGQIKYSVDGMGVVLDSDCMSTEIKDTVRYLILRPNCKLYSKWDDPGSLIF